MHKKGFTLPLVMLISVGLMIVGVSLMRSTSAISSALTTQYVNQITNEAAEAGVAYASYCLKQNDFVQTWGTAAGKPALKPNTDCTGTTIGGMADTVLVNRAYSTTFSVDDLDTREDGAIIINAQGTAKTTANAVTVTRLNSVKKQVLKWKQFQPSVSSSGTSKTCGIVSDELYCWGMNSDTNFDGSASSEVFWGNLGDGTTTNSLVPVKVSQQPGVLAGKKVSSVSSAQFHSCALAEGKVYCWGRNNSAQMGQGNVTQPYYTSPVEVQGALSGLTVTAIGATGDTSCAIAGGKIYCWGRNNQSAHAAAPYGTVGINSTVTYLTTPTLVYAPGGSGLPANYNATALTTGSRSFNMCAIADGKAYCWGNNQAGQIGDGTSGAAAYALYPKAVRANVGDALYGKTVTAIGMDGYPNPTAQFSHACAVADAKVYCWGENGDGALGTGNTTDSSLPVAVSTTGVLAGKTILDVVVGLTHACVLASDNKMYCWGNNTNGQLGTGNITDSLVPIAVRANSGDALYNKVVSKIGGGSNRSCAITGIRSYCWGLNSVGQLGDGTQTSRTLPTESIFLRPKAPSFMF